MVPVADQRRGLWRSRWAAMGAAVAVALGGGGFFGAQAASSPASSVVTIDPVRILDTRDPANVGLPGPFVSAVSQKLLVAGKSGIPVGATGVLLNVTVVGPSANGFLSVRPGDATGVAATSSLNFNAGDIVPNSVQVGLPTSGANAGQIDITYDAFGVVGPTTEVLIDVVGYMIAGAAGPAGPTGPGARLVDVPVDSGVVTAVGTFEGVSISALCGPGQTTLFLGTTVGTNALRVAGIQFVGIVPEDWDVMSAAGVGIGGDSGPLHFTGLVRNTTLTTSLQIEIHVSAGFPCRVWGSIVPVNPSGG